ncbi:hypothetical protein K9L67_06145 [Candidatus Woesearchaeota archaeon]|nr:hypothetical protein [Candidatus Woesearchaeota archaeon]MCF7901774.1 hypothetical protein [Candidatus Woesearchaeota archaeon]MCF8013158.1 hypothetical protein [Candidatus Woesearchaeota archaeon]
MVVDKSLIVSCINKECSKYKKHLRGNVIKFGKQKNGVPRFKCVMCGKTFTKTNKIRKNMKISKEEFVNICRLMARKMSFRKISQKTGKHLDTIRGVADRIANNYRKMKNYFKEDLKMEDHEVESMWDHIKKKKKIKEDGVENSEKL